MTITTTWPRATTNVRAFELVDGDRIILDSPWIPGKRIVTVRNVELGMREYILWFDAITADGVNHGHMGIPPRDYVRKVVR